MQQFRTTLQPTPSSFTITHQDHILAMGSCFAEHIAQRLQKHKFPTLLNPFGILYNPISIAHSLQWLLSEEHYPRQSLFEHQGLWHSFHHHGRFSAPTQEEAYHQISHHLKQGRQFLQKTNRLILTFGTAHVFEHLESARIVANCHKRPNNEFARKRLTVNQIVTALSPIFEKIQASQPQNPKPKTPQPPNSPTPKPKTTYSPTHSLTHSLSILLTVSPVRHIRDGLIENQRSKAVLLLAIDELCQQFPFVHYFPSYELLLDDLRDYRFYADDLIHPSTMAIDYIWDFFGKTFFPATTQQLNQKIQAINSAIQHRPFHPESEQHQAFLRKQREKLEQLVEQYPDLDWGDLLSFFGKTKGTKQG
jgi:hypothetical protein